MISLIADKAVDSQFLLSLFVAIAAAATVLTIAIPLTEGSNLQKRMKNVATEREKIRARERERLNRQTDRVSLRQEPKAFMRRVVQQFKLGDWLGTETAKHQLTMAGYRGQQAEIAFLFFRLVAPIGLFLFTLFYVFVINDFGQSVLVRLGMAVGGAYVGIKAPELFLSNQISSRSSPACRSSTPSARSRPRSAASRCRSPRSSPSARPSCPICRSASRPMRILPLAPASRG